MKLFLKPTGSHLGTDWGPDDYVVLYNGDVIGRIFLHPQAPAERPWFWTITAMGQPPSTDNRGYADTLQHAMADFRARLAV